MRKVTTSGSLFKKYVAFPRGTPSRVEKLLPGRGSVTLLIALMVGAIVTEVAATAMLVVVSLNIGELEFCEKLVLLISLNEFIGTKNPAGLRVNSRTLLRALLSQSKTMSWKIAFANGNKSFKLGKRVRVPVINRKVNRNIALGTNVHSF